MRRQPRGGVRTARLRRGQAEPYHGNAPAQTLRGPALKVASEILRDSNNLDFRSTTHTTNGLLGCPVLHKDACRIFAQACQQLAKKPVARADLEKTITEALDGHLCRCTGYIKYHEAVRDVILADPDRYLSRA